MSDHPDTPYVEIIRWWAGKLVLAGVIGIVAGILYGMEAGRAGDIGWRIIVGASVLFLGGVGLMRAGR